MSACQSQLCFVLIFLDTWGINTCALTGEHFGSRLVVLNQLYKSKGIVRALKKMLIHTRPDFLKTVTSVKSSSKATEVVMQVRPD